MTDELDLYGVFLPGLLVASLVALVLGAALRRLLDAAGIYRLVWHRALVDLALLVLVLGAVSAAFGHWGVR